MRRMAVNHAFHIGPGLHDLQVQQRLARSLLATGCLLSGHVNRANVVGSEKPFAAKSRRAKHFVLADADGNVPIIRSGKPAFVDAVANIADVLFEAFDVGSHGESRRDIEGMSKVRNFSIVMHLRLNYKEESFDSDVTR